MSLRSRLGIVLLIAVLLRLPVFFFPYVNIDENEYAVAARIILDGGLPYRDFLIYQPPAIYYLYAAAFWLFGTIQLWAPHLLVLGIVGATCATLFAIGRLAWNERAGLWAALCYAIFSITALPSDMLGANCEVVLVLPLCAAVWALLRWEHAPTQSLWWLVLCGACSSLAFLTKYPAGLFMAPLGLYVLWRAERQRWLAAGVLTFSWCVPIACTAYALWWGGAWDATVGAWQYILLYAKGPPQLDPLYLALKFTARTAAVAAAGALMWWHACGAIWQLGRARAHKKTPDESLLFPLLICVLLLTGLALTLLGGRVYYHYYYFAIPWLALLAGNQLAQAWPSYSARQRRCWIGWSALPVAMLWTYCLYKAPQGAITDTKWVEAAQELRDIASRPASPVPSPSLFVWGYAPQFYTVTGLRPATRFTTADYLTGRTPKTAGLEYNPLMQGPPTSWQKFLADYLTYFRPVPDMIPEETSANIFPGAWDLLAQDYARRLPDYIVDTAPANYRFYGRYPITNYPLLRDQLAAHYTEVGRRHGFVFYQRNRNAPDATPGAGDPADLQ